MGSCCGFRVMNLRQAESDFVWLARRAAKNPTQENVEALAPARAHRDDQKKFLDEHLSWCGREFA